MARYQVPPPPYTPATGGLLDVATLRDDADPHWRDGVDWEALCVAAAAATEVDCEDDTPPWVADPTGFPGVTGWLPFQLYHRHACSPVGRTLEEHEQLAAEALGRGEARAIEAVVERGAVSDDGALGTLAASLAANAEPVTDAPSTVVDAVAALEQHLGWRYGGQGVLHMPRLAAVLAVEKGVVETAGQGRFRTGLGTPVAVGTGYMGTGPDGPDDDQVSIYATGPVVIYRGLVTPLGTAREGFDRGVNTVALTVIRTVLVGWDCLALRADVAHTVPPLPAPEPES